MPDNLTAIDLFAGAGGFSLAAHNLGIDILAAIELDSYAASTYQKNLVERLNVNAQVLAEDINCVDIKKLMASHGLKQGALDLLLGGPPCQGFSTHRINNAGQDDPRNELLLRYFDFVEELRPKAFLVENVPGLLWKRHESYLNRFLELSHEHGFKVIGGGPLIINARDYGVPQSRKRAFILALRDDVNDRNLEWPPTPTHFKDKYPLWQTSSCVFSKPPKAIIEKFEQRLSEKFSFSEAESKKIVRDLRWGENILKDDPCNIHMQHSEELVNVFSSTPLLGDRQESERELDCHKNYGGHKDVYGRIYPHTPSNTITTGCNNPSKGRFVHPWLNHGITLRHAARLQSFPDDYDFFGGSMAAGRQIGNAVPIKLGEALIASIKINLDIGNGVI